MVITHSEYVVENLRHEQFFNLDGYKTEREWMDREIVPTDLEALKDDSLALYRFVNKMSEKKKAEK